MKPLTLDDLLPLTEYASRRREFFDSHLRYLDRYRRVRIGPRLTLIFENRQTLWFRIQEIIRIARLSDPALLQQELDLYNRLLPKKNQLQAALIIEVEDEKNLAQELAPWQNLHGKNLRLVLGGKSYPSQLITCRPEDRCIGMAHWAQFELPPSARKSLADFAQTTLIEYRSSAENLHSPPLSDDLRQSMLDDLKLSDQDGMIN